MPRLPGLRLLALTVQGLEACDRRGFRLQSFWGISFEAEQTQGASTLNPTPLSPKPLIHTPNPQTVSLGVAGLGKLCRVGKTIRIGFRGIVQLTSVATRGWLLL